jgi:hypothetical protein
MAARDGGSAWWRPIIVLNHLSGRLARKYEIDTTARYRFHRDLNNELYKLCRVFEVVQATLPTS